jgi:lyso-ornithine lipid O-acyltransferase
VSRVVGVFRASVRLARTAGLVVATTARSGRTARAGGRAEQMHARAALFARACRTALRIHGIEVGPAGPVPRGPALLVSNHLSYLDPIVLAALVDCVPISKSDLASWPLFGVAARKTGVIFVERSSPQSRMAVIREAEQVLRDGGIVLNFPEGTTTDGSTVLRFRKGLFGIAQAMGLPVVPVGLSYEPRELAWIGDDTFVPHYLRLASRPFSVVRVAFGEPLPSRAYQGAQDLATAAHARTVSLLGDRTPGLRQAD